MSSTDGNSTNATGIVTGHAEYVKGAASSLVGSVTGSEAWKESGEQTKQEASEHIKEAAQQTKQASDTQPGDNTSTGGVMSAAEKACPAVGGGVGQSPSKTDA